MIYTIQESIEHNRNFFEGSLVGFYHDPKAMVGDQCLAGNITDDYGFIMKIIYEQETLMHFLDILKFSKKVTDLIESIFEHCGPKVVIEDIRNFCSVDKKRCTWPIVLTNAWWRMLIKKR